MKKYLNEVTSKLTPQGEKAPGRPEQILDNEGGFVWGIDVWGRLNRFLILGSEGGSYYASERNLTKQNVDSIVQALGDDYKKAIDIIVDVSHSGRAPSNDPAIFALAMAASYNRTSSDPADQAVRAYALSKVNNVCRIGTHIFTFAQYIQNMRGWGRGLRNAIGNWYLGRSPKKLAYQLVKYRQRGGWSHRDLLRKAHPNTILDGHDYLFKWVTQPDKAAQAPPTDWGRFIGAFEQAKTETDENKLVKLIIDNGLPREAIPTKFLSKPKIWDAMLPSMPATAMIRNLGNMTRHGLLTPTSSATQWVVTKLGQQDWLRKSRVHPITVLNALTVYRLGRRLRGRRGEASRADYSVGSDWIPVPAITIQLDKAFYATFDSVEPTNKRLLLALDVSSSMAWWFIAGTGLSPSKATAAMALVTAKTEPFYQTVAFKNEISHIDITGDMRLQDAIRLVEDVQFGGTDCSLPMTYAIDNNLEIDTFIVYTDNETGTSYSRPHPFQELQRYREKSGINAKLIVVGMLANQFSIADPQDGGMLDVVGFDTRVPTIMNDFIRGRV